MDEHVTYPCAYIEQFHCRYLANTSAPGDDDDDDEDADAIPGTPPDA